MRQRNIVDGCIFTLFGARYESNLILWETHVGRSNRWNVHLLSHTHTHTHTRIWKQVQYRDRFYIPGVLTGRRQRLFRPLLAMESQSLE
jgi:hypothetical protein